MTRLARPTGMASRSRCLSARGLLFVPSWESEGAGNAGCAMHPQPRVRK